MSEEEKAQAPLSQEDALKFLTQSFFQTREKCSAKSLSLLQAHQRFLKKLEDMKHAKDDADSRKQEYVDQATVYALRDAELRYQKACLLEAEHEWAEMVAERHGRVRSLRAVLLQQLQSYSDERRKTATLQAQVTVKTEEDRINALNSVAFCTYAQSMIESEVKKLCTNTTVPNQRYIQKLQQGLNDVMKSVRQDTRRFHEDKVRAFKRQERILFGRGRDANAEALLGSNLRLLAPDSDNNNAAGGNNSTASGGASGAGSGGAGDILAVDSLENRIATRLIAQNAAQLYGAALDDKPSNNLNNNSHSSSNPVITPTNNNTTAGLSAERLAAQQYDRTAVSEDVDPIGYVYPYKTLPPRRTMYMNPTPLSTDGGGGVGGATGATPRRATMMQPRGTMMSGSHRSPRALAHIQATAGMAAIDTSHGQNAHSRTSPAVTPAAANHHRHAAAGTYANLPSSVFSRSHYPAATTPANNNNNNGNNNASSTSDVYAKPHSLWDLNAAPIAEREQRLASLALQWCECRGKVQQLTVLRDELDAFVLKSCALLLSVLLPPVPHSASNAKNDVDADDDDNDDAIELLESSPPRNINNNNNNSSLRNKTKTTQNNTSQKAQTLRLSAQRKIVQLDCAQKEQDTQLLRTHILALLQPRRGAGDGAAAAPGTAALVAGN